MMNKQQHSGRDGFANRPRTLNFCTFALLLLALAAVSAVAQTVTMRANPVRITVPFGSTSSSTSTVTMVVAGLVEANGDSVSYGIAGTPAGATVNFYTTNSIYSNGTFTATLAVDTTASLAQGTHDLAIQASGTASYRLPVPLICSYVWSGVSFTNGTSTNWNATGNWIGGVVPGASDNVVFRDTGGDPGNTTTNVVISANTTVSSIRFANELNNNTDNNNIEFQSGAKLTVAGPGGLALLRDSKTVGRALDVRMFGEGGLVVNNPAADFGTYIDFQVNATLDLRNLNTLELDVRRVPLGDYRAYPNYYTNGWQGTGIGTGGANEVNRFVSLIWLAKTNLIKASFVDPNNYTDLGQRDYALTIGNNNVQGSTSNLRLTLGNSNAFFLDSICFAQAVAGGSGNNFNFNAANSYALFRGNSGLNSRISVFALSDTASSTPQGVRANARSQVNFANQNNCAVDALIDQLWMSVDRTNYTSTANPVESMAIQTSLTYGAGTFDVNKAYLGYQRSGDNVNPGLGFQTEATLNLNSNASSAGAIMKINDTLHLGYTTATVVGPPTQPERTWGRVVITGGTLMVSNIACGGVTKLATNNQITVNGGKLIVTNAIGSADGRIAVFTLSGSPEVTLLGVKAGETNIFVDVFTAAAAGGVKYIRIPSVAGVGAYPVRIPLVSYTAGTPVFNGVSIVPPPGLYVKTLVDNPTDRTIDLTLTDEPPTVVVWRGNVNNAWDVTTPNWVTQSGGIQTNYSEGFSVVFDDTVGAGPTSIDISSAVTPGQVAAAYGVVVSNKSYTLNSGTLLGGSTIYKTGSGNLTINAISSPGVTLDSGALMGSGTIGSTLLKPGSTMTSFTGTINGGLIASNATVAVASTVNGGLNLQAGSLANNGTINGNVTIGTNTYFTNGSTINVNVPWRVSTNATLVNNGVISQTAVGNNNGLTVDGTLKGTGKITAASGVVADARVTMAAGSTLMIGNQPNEITNMTIATRLDFLQGATTTFDVDTGTGSNDKIILDEPFVSLGKVNFGAGNNPGGTFIVNRVAGPAFHLATTLNFFDQTFQVPDNSNQALPGFTPAPAPGLAWDTTAILTNLTLKVTGLPSLTNSITIGTNGVASYEFSWGADRRGWRLERNLDTNSIGIDVTGTNWETLQYTYGGTNVYYPDTNNLDVYYFRNVQTIATTNKGAYFRLTYP